MNIMLGNLTVSQIEERTGIEEQRRINAIAIELGFNPTVWTERQDELFERMIKTIKRMNDKCDEMDALKENIEGIKNFIKAL